MVNNINDLKNIYYLLNDDNAPKECADSSLIINDDRARFRIKYLSENNEYYKSLLYVEVCRAKNVRKLILKTNYKDDIKSFNDELRLKENYKFIQNYHTPELWIIQFIKILKSRVNNRINEVKKLVDYNYFLEGARLAEDDRLLIEISTRHLDDYNDYLFGDNYSERMKTKCKKTIHYFYKNKFYDYRVNYITGDKHVYYSNDGINIEFTEGSYDDYFIDRDYIINLILG